MSIYVISPIDKEPQQVASALSEGSPSLQWLQEQVGGTIEVIKLNDHQQMIVNENGKLLGLPINNYASKVYKEDMVSRFNLNERDTTALTICGTVVILSDKHRAG